MTDEEKIALIRLLIGDIEGSPFFPLYTDADLLKFLQMSGGNVNKAGRMAAISASMILAGWSTRERAGNIEVENNLSTNYLKALDYLIRNPDRVIPDGLFPWFGSKNGCAKLLNIQICDEDECCGCDTCKPYGPKF